MITSLLYINSNPISVNPIRYSTYCKLYKSRPINYIWAMISNILLIFCSVIYTITSLVVGANIFFHHDENNIRGHNEIQVSSSVEGEHLDKQHNQNDDCNSEGKCWSCNEDICCNNAWWCLSHCISRVTFYTTISNKKPFESNILDSAPHKPHLVDYSDYIVSSVFIKHKKLYISYQESQFPQFRIGTIVLTI
jgi:hypothetical protein